MRVWLCVLVFVISGAFGNSIMDMINTKKLEKFLAERRQNNTRETEERRILQVNAVDGELMEDFGEGPFEDDVSETESADLNSRQLPLRPRIKNNSIQRTGGRNLSGIPVISAVLADLTSVPQKHTYLVTKKDYVKKDWCKTEPIIQKVREDGCESKNILNRFCYGQCNSFFVPKNPPKKRRPRRKGADDELDEMQAFKACSFCKPKKVAWIYVTLKCPGLTPPYRKRKVQRVRQCDCVAEDFLN